MGLLLDTSHMRRRLERLRIEQDRAVTALIDSNAPEVANYAKINAPWTDRTTNARNGLFAVPEHQGTRHSIVLSHGVHYGIWLEVANEGRYAIIDQALVAMGERIMEQLNGLYGRL